MQTGQLLLNEQIWIPCVTRAATTWQRMRGLLGCRTLPVGHGLLIERCGAIHMIGMRFAIDVVFLDRTWRVCRVCRNVRPGRLMVAGGWGAARALEVATGWLQTTDVTPGTQLDWQVTPTITPAYGLRPPVGASASGRSATSPAGR